MSFSVITLHDIPLPFPPTQFVAWQHPSIVMNGLWPWKFNKLFIPLSSTLGRQQLGWYGIVAFIMSLQLKYETASPLTWITLHPESWNDMDYSHILLKQKDRIVMLVQYQRRKCFSNWRKFYPVLVFVSLSPLFQFIYDFGCNAYRVVVGESKMGSPT